MHYMLEYTEFCNFVQILKTIKGIHINNTNRLRLFLDAIYFMSKAGCAWRILPFHYGCYRAVHKRYTAWSKRGIWEKIFNGAQVEPNLEREMVDSTVARAHACAAGYQKNSQEEEALGRSKGGFSTKIHAKTDALGYPLKLLLTPGNRNDITQAENLLEGSKNNTIIADKGYDCDKFIEAIKAAGSVPVIPPRSNRKELRDYDKIIYKERHHIECFFGKMKHFRRLFSRYEKIAKSYLSFWHFVGTLIWFR